MARAFGAIALSSIALLLCTSSCFRGTNVALPLEIIQIDERSPAAETRFRRLTLRLDQVFRRPYSITRIEADITSPESIRSALAQARDTKEMIVLAGSGVMANAAISRFSEATVLFASQHDPAEFGLLSVPRRATERRTGFTYDVNIVPQVLSILARSKIPVRKIAVIADRYLAAPWRDRLAATQLKFPELQFRVYEVNNDLDLQNCFTNADSTNVDVWFMLEGVAFAGQFESIKTELEKRRKIGVYPGREQVDSGGLMAYEPRVSDPFGIWARQISLIADGVLPSEIPVETPSEFTLSINLDAARRIGLTFTTAVIKTSSRVVFADRPSTRGHAVVRDKTP